MRRSNIVLGVLAAFFCVATAGCDAFVGPATAPSVFDAIHCGDQTCPSNGEWTCSSTLPKACMYVGTMGLPSKAKDGGV